MTGVLAESRPAAAGLVVVGAGVAGLRVVQTVRGAGYDGPVTLVGAEPHLPYDRPPLSKQVLQGQLSPESTEYHPAEYFDDLDVQVLLGATASRVDAEKQRLWLTDGNEVPYGALVVATGSRPRQLPFATPNQGLHVLRTREDAIALRADLDRSTRLAIVGAGFVGAEVASTAAAMGIDVTVVETAPTPLVRAVGAQIGHELATLHETAGVKLVCEKAVTGFIGSEHVEGLTLDDGSILGVDLVLLGVGVVPDVEWLDGTGLDLRDGLVCDEYLTSTRTIYGAGDAVSWPSARMGRTARSQQWTTASDQGRHVGRVLIEGEVAGAFDHDLYFWSDQYTSRIQGTGIPTKDVVMLSRASDSKSFVAAFRSKGHVVGAVGVNSPKAVMALRKLTRRSADWSEVEDLLEAMPELNGGSR
jgi:NADPH-dependent 2,4-dienoyl-CoA reductase/sulfur reductase-like enzyme